MPEIERKFLVETLPAEAEACPRVCIEQSYVSIDPVIRVRRRDDRFYLTKKGAGLMVREELEEEISEAEYLKLKEQAVYHTIKKTRFLIPREPFTIELDLFHGLLEGLLMAEVEFPDAYAALHFSPPDWFGPEVTGDPRFCNNHLCTADRPPVL